MEIVSGFLQGLRLSVLQNQNTTSHYNNFAVEHKWELPSVASGSKGESLLALVNSNYLHTALFHDFFPFQCCWIFECSNSPLSPLSPESLGGRVAKTQMGLKFPQIPLFFPLIFCVSRTALSHVAMCLFKSMSHPLTLRRHWQGIYQWNLGVITQNSNDKNHLSLITPHPLREQSTVAF